ncbi:MAG TPA: hypothetical protein VEA35_01890 [Ramlibacter sp.]|nr:hypothetical protein [Ramlibacter sp.]
MKLLRTAPLLLLAGCLGTSEPPPQYTLTGGEKGVFQSRNAGSPIALERIRGMTEQEVVATFGPPVLDRKDTGTRVLRYQSDACTLFIFVAANKAQFADAHDTHLRPLPVDQCAGSVAAQKRRSA